MGNETRDCPNCGNDSFREPLIEQGAWDAAAKLEEDGQERIKRVADRWKDVMDYLEDKPY